MKKILLVVAIASFAVACNNKSEKKETTDTTTTVAPVSPVGVDTSTIIVDTTKKADTTSK